MPFKLAKTGHLAPPTLFLTAEEAIAAGNQAWPGRDFDVQTVRQAKLSDFVVPANIVGDIREQMAAKVGNETPLDDAIGDGHFQPEDFGVELGAFMDSYAEAFGFTMPGVVIVESTRTIRAE